MLTKKQKQILDYIKKFIKENGYSPSIPEIGRRFKLANSTIHEHLINLKENECTHFSFFQPIERR